MKSMTGFGRGRCEVAGRRLIVEIRAVNHRFVDLKMRLPWNDPVVEQQLTAAIKRRIARGSVGVTVRDESGGPGSSVEMGVDVGLAKAYAGALRRIAEACGLDEKPPISLVAEFPGVIQLGQGALEGEPLWAALSPGVSQALDELVSARGREGEALRLDLAARGRTLRELSAEIGRLAANAPDEAKRRLEERLKKLLSGTETQGLALDPQRLAQEIALLADRADVAEELTRLGLHLDELERLLGDPEPAGRRLDFLIQELHREVNTVGSKAQRAEIAARVVDAKAEVERLREQVQNVE